MMARQAGKNELSRAGRTDLLLRSTAAGRSTAIKCAPTFEPQGYISLRRLRDRIVQAGIEESASIEEPGRFGVGNARQLFLSAETSANVVGHTAGLLLEVDEAQDVDAEKFDREFRPMAAATGATIVYYGTPWDDSTLLAQAVETNLELSGGTASGGTSRPTGRSSPSWNPEYARYVEGERARLGENHPLFLTQYALQDGIRRRAAVQRRRSGRSCRATHSRQASPRRRRGVRRGAGRGRAGVRRNRGTRNEEQA